MICSRCGTPNDGNGRFCVECGAPLNLDSATIQAGGAAPTPAATPVGAAPVPAPPMPGMPPVPMPGQSASGGAGAPGAGRPQMPPMPAGSMPTAPAPGASAPGVGGPIAPQGNGGAPGAPGVKSAVRNRRMVVIVAAVMAVVLVVAVGVTAFLTYRAEVWGGKTLPDPTSLIAGASGSGSGDGVRQSKKSVVKAKDVTEALKGKGLAVKTVTEFSGEDRGAFLGYQGLEPGQRVSNGSTVTVRESAGPGVPKDTVGRKATDVVKTFNTMGVPVHYKNVVIAPDSKTPEGQVSVTWPTPGTGLADKDKDDGIYIGVTHKGDGIPVDILGQDKDATVNALESQGYDVDLEPHYSSKQYVGKISGSYPAPGSTLSSGAHVTLYYGVDKSSNMDLLSKTTGSGDYAMTVVNNNATPMIGMYCKSKVTDASKDCITLEEAESPYGNSGGGGFMQIKERPADSLYDNLGLTNWSQDVSSIMLSTDGYPGMKQSDLPMANHLLLGKTGAFELYAGMGMPNCGDVTSQMDIGSYCDNGTYRTYDPSGGWYPSGSTGLTFRMKDFLVYVPVGADVKALEDSGYFDKTSLATAKKQKAVDTSRPFIIMRDSSQYDQTEKSIGSNDKWVDPFVPGNEDGKNPLVAMKPAPSDPSVYYLVEQNGDLDWDSLPDAKVDGAKDSSDSGSDGSGAKKTYTKDEVRDLVGDGDFTPIAGTYCLQSEASCVTLGKDGMLKLKSGEKPKTYSHDVKLSLRSGSWDYYADGNDQFLDLTAPDSDYRCSTDDGTSYTGSDCVDGPFWDNGGSEADISQRPVNPLYIFEGSSFDVANGETPFDPGSSSGGDFSSDRPCLYFMGYHMNPAPTDATVYYLKE